jgi:hypothetical protein
MALRFLVRIVDAGDIAESDDASVVNEERQRSYLGGRADAFTDGQRMVQTRPALDGARLPQDLHLHDA